MKLFQEWVRYRTRSSHGERTIRSPKIKRYPPESLSWSCQIQYISLPTEFLIWLWSEGRTQKKEWRPVWGKTAQDHVLFIIHAKMGTLHFKSQRLPSEEGDSSHSHIVWHALKEHDALPATVPEFTEACGDSVVCVLALMTLRPSRACGRRAASCTGVWWQNFGAVESLQSVKRGDKSQQTAPASQPLSLSLSPSLSLSHSHSLAPHDTQQEGEAPPESTIRHVSRWQICHTT